MAKAISPIKYEATTVNSENIINMIAQTNPGKPKGEDSKISRLKAFEKCLTQIAELHSEESFSVAFPYGIGCGLAGGDWKEYEKMLRDFANLFPHIEVIVCKFE